MEVLEFNNFLKNIINDIISENEFIPNVKQKISRILLGTNRQSSVNSWLDGKRDTPYGIKPLSKLGEIFGYDVCVVMVKKSDDKTKDDLYRINLDFLKNFRVEMIDYVNSDVKLDDAVNSIIDQPVGSKYVIAALDDILSSDDNF
jgi:hypothetical protein